MNRLIPKYLLLIYLMLFVPNWMPLFAITEPPFDLPPQKSLSLIKSGVISTNKGNIYFVLYPEKTPWHVTNFKYLADKGFYNNMKFHKYLADVAIQTGAPTAKANSGPGYTLPAEFNNEKHILGSLSMVRKPNDLDYEHLRRSHGSQFRLILGRAKHMDGQFVVFGRVVKGFDVLKRLRIGDTIKELKVFVRK